MLNGLLLLVNAFWFGEKLITRTGLLEIFRKKEDSGG
jgi:hypothetical protein